MKNLSILFALVTSMVLSCTSNQEAVIQINNPLDQTREDAVVLLSRSEVSNLMEILPGKIPFLEEKDGSAIPCQADDLNGDGQWDELFFMVNLQPSGQKTVVLRFVDPAEFPEFKIRTNLRLGAANMSGYPELKSANRLEGVGYQNYGDKTGAAFQMEGPAWENDRVGFRNYLDQRNGMDIFGKLVGEMVLDSVGVAGKPSYHEPADWGMDILKVGTSLGAGGIGYLYRDSIYRVGDNGSGTYEAVVEGPLRSRFNLSFQHWMVESIPVEVEHQIEILAGRHFYQGTVTCSGTEETLSLVPGIVNMKSNKLHVVELDNNHTALITIDAQSEDGSLLAMALVLPNTNLIRYGETRDQGEGIIETYFAVLEAGAGQPVPYRFYALWEKEDPRWASLEQVTGYLKTEASRWTQSVVIEVLR